MVNGSGTVHDYYLVGTTAGIFDNYVVGTNIIQVIAAAAGRTIDGSTFVEVNRIVICIADNTGCGSPDSMEFPNSAIKCKICAQVTTDVELCCSQSLPGVIGIVQIDGDIARTRSGIELVVVCARPSVHTSSVNEHVAAIHHDHSIVERISNQRSERIKIISG